jgi:hypothetical protein
MKPKMIPTTTGKFTKYGSSILSNGTLDRMFKGPVPLNRSSKWNYADTYQEARNMSPSDRPVEGKEIGVIKNEVKVVG